MLSAGATSGPSANARAAIVPTFPAVNGCVLEAPTGRASIAQDDPDGSWLSAIRMFFTHG